MSIRSWIVIGSLAVAAAGITVAGGAIWWYGRQAHEERVARLNAEARADTLKLEWAAADSMKRIYERQAMIAVKAIALSEELARQLERSDETARAMVDLYVDARDRFVVESTARASGDSTLVHFEKADSTFQSKIDVTLAGRLDPPNARARAEVDWTARIRAMLALSCDEAGAPHARVQTFDRRVTVADLLTEVDEDVACLPPPPSFFDFALPRFNVGTSILVGGAFVGGVIVGSRVTP